MRNISFFLTQEQIRNRTKTVTRRHGWRSLKPGTLLQGVLKSQGLKRGEKITKLAVIRVVGVRLEPLNKIITDFNYGLKECAREGFGDYPQLMWPTKFVDFFCDSHRGCTPDTEVTRIEFEFVD
jgi:hypothetical protein